MNRVPVPKIAPSERTTKKPGWFGWASGHMITIVCADCGRNATLNHAIAANGDVTPSVVCPFEGCTWHVFVRLSDWDGGEIADKRGV